MEKIKNLLNPGKKHDNEVMYGSGLNDDPVHDQSTGLSSGEGSHLGASRAAAEETPVTSTDPTSIGRGTTDTGYHSGVNEKPFSSHGLGTTDVNEPSSTHGASRTTADETPITSTDPTSTGSGTTDTGYHSGVNEKPFSSHGLGTTAVNEPSSTHGASRTTADETPVTSTDPTSTGGGTTGTGYQSSVNEKPFSSHGLGTTDLNEPSSTHGASRILDDTATTASIKSGVPGNPQPSPLTSSKGNKDAVETNKPLPNEPTGAGLRGTPDKSATGPHSSSLANRADPRVASDLDGSKGLGGSATGTGSGLTGCSLPDRSIEGSGYGNDFQTSDSSNLGRDTAIGAGAFGAGALGASTAAHHHHDRQQGTDPTDPTNSGRSFPLGGHSATTSSSEFPSGFTGKTGSTPAGPHSSNLANKADPRVDSDLDGSRTVGSTGYGSTATGYGSGTGPTTGSGHQGSLEQDRGLAGSTGATAVGSGLAGYGLESSKHGHGGHGHTYEGDPCEGGEPAVPGPHFTTGPHATDTANRLDPHVASGVGKPSATTHADSGSEVGSTIHSGDHHDRNTALAGGAGAAGISAFGSSRDAPDSVAGSKTDSAGPHKSSLLNKLDPRVDSDLSKQQGSTGTTGSSGLTGTSALGSDSHEKHLRDQGPSNTAGISDPYSSSGVDPRVDFKQSSSIPGSTDPTEPGKHHYSRDAGLAGTGGVAAYEAGKHLGKDTSASQGSGIPESTYGTSYDNTQTATSTGNDPQSGTGHHYGRDAGLAGLGAGSVAAHETEKHKDRGEPTTTTSSSTYPSSGYDDRDRTTESHTGRNTALAGGAGAGLGAAAGAELSNKEAEKLEKQQNKEIEKEQKAIHKDQLKHEKTLEKEEKKHEKALEKEEKKHEKALAKDDKKHEDGHKHGGILGLFHRDKPDKDLKEEELQRQGAGSHSEAETAAGIGAVGASGESLKDQEKHERNRLHKDPPAGYYQSSGYGDEPKHGYAAEVTGGTGTTALAQGEDLPSGPHLTSTGNKVDPFVPGTGSSLDASGTGGQTAIEPHTGLPIDLSKGTGEGGTDGTPVPGYHSHDGRVPGGTTGEHGSGHSGSNAGTAF